MAVLKGQTITAADVNNLVQNVENVYSVGQGDSGYGQTTYVLDDLEVGGKIQASEWSKLRGMMLVSGSHQGTPISQLFNEPSAGLKIMATVSTLTLAQTLWQNRLHTAIDALSTWTGAAVASYSSDWHGVLEVTIDVSFQSEDQARYFFNSGGAVRITPIHPSTATSTDTNFAAFLAQQVGSFYVGAHQYGTTGPAAPSTFAGGYYAVPATDTVITTQTSTSSLSTAPDFVDFHIRRTGYQGTRGANGTGFQIIVHMQCLGDSGGSKLTAGTAIRVDTVLATKYLSIATPNYAIGGMHLVAPSGGNTGGGVDTIPPYDPAPGTVTYTVPEYATIMFELMGGGGSEGSSTGPYPRTDGSTIHLAIGTNGGDASIPALGLLAKGGAGGGTYNFNTNTPALPGADGVGTGGDVNTTGGGAAGGSGRYAGQTGYRNGGAGGAGAYVKKVYVRGASGAPSPGDVLVLSIPTGGSQASLGTPQTDFYPGADGTMGHVKVTITTTGTGSVSFSTPGAYQFTVPSYTSITFDVNGAGGGQGHPFDEMGVPDYYVNGEPTDSTFNIPLPSGSIGGTSSIRELNLYGRGGYGGGYIGFVNTAPRWLLPVPGYSNLFMDLPPRVTAQAGANGPASGGQTNTTGGGASGGYILYFGDPILAAQGPNANKWKEGANGGNGGRAVITYAPTDQNAPTAGQVLTVAVGAGGAPAPIDPRQMAYGTVYATGNNGFVNINWTGSVTVIDNPV